MYFLFYSRFGIHVQNSVPFVCNYYAMKCIQGLTTLIFKCIVWFEACSHSLFLCSKNIVCWALQYQFMHWLHFFKGCFSELPTSFFCWFVFLCLIICPFSWFLKGIIYLKLLFLDQYSVVYCGTFWKEDEVKENAFLPYLISFSSYLECFVN